MHLILKTQVGVIVYADNVDNRSVIESYKARGFACRLCDGYAEIWEAA